MKSFVQNCAKTIAVILILVFTSKVQVSACSLALHDWKLFFYLKIPLSAPIVPLSEIDIASEKISPDLIDKVLWQTNHNILTSVLISLIPLLESNAKNYTWIPIQAKDSVLSIARTLLDSDKPPLILGSEKNFLKVALFSDKNSFYNCHQLVFLQQNRIRGVLPSKLSPWAQEINGQAWFSLIFFQIPVPGKILSFSIFPFAGQRKSIYEDHPFVEKLLAEKKLFRRPDLKVDPYSNDFPNLPE